MPRRNTEWVYVQGKASWAKLNILNMYGKYTIKVHLDEPSIKIVQQLVTEGIQNKLGKDEDGYFMQFSRPPSVNMKGREVILPPPQVYMPDGMPLRGDVMIGNGSDVTVKLAVYSHMGGGIKKKACRLESVRVDNLVPYEMNRDFDDEDKAKSWGLDEQPAQQAPQYNF